MLKESGLVPVVKIGEDILAGSDRGEVERSDG